MTGNGSFLERAMLTQAVPRFPNQSAVPDDTRKFQVGPRLALDDYVYDDLTF